MPTTTPRLTLVQPLVGDTSNEDRLAEAANASLLDVSSQLTTGTFAALPGASSSNVGSFYKATDIGVLYGSTGTTWVPENMITSTASGSVTAKSGQWLIAGNFTITAPAASPGAIFGVQASSSNAGSAPTTVSGGGANIFGVGANGVSSVLLGTANSFSLFRSDGTSWYIVNGQQDTGWNLLSPATNYQATQTGNPPAGYNAQCRLRGDMVQLRGGMQCNSTPGALPVQVGNLPSSLYYPPQLIQVNVDTGTGTALGSNIGLITISTGGVINYGGGSSNIQNGWSVWFDSITYPIS